jgi:hypothetical protein
MTGECSVKSNVLDVVQALGIEGIIRGDEYVAPCPAHAERTGSPDAHPSWSVNLTAGISYCFSCHYKSSLQGLIVFMVGEESAKDWSVGEASLDSRGLLRRLAGVTSNLYIKPVTNVGFSETALDVFTTAPKWALKKRDVSEQACLEMGALWDGRQNMWSLLVRNAAGNLLGWQQKSDKGSKRFNNWPTGMSMADCLFGLQCAEKNMKPNDSIVVVESPLDAVRLWDMGFPAVAIYGSILSASQVSLLKHHHVIVAPDNDAAGKRMMAHANGVLPMPKVVSWGRYSTGVDPGDLSRTSLSRLVLDSRSILSIRYPPSRAWWSDARRCSPTRWG